MEKYKCDICGKNHDVFRGLESPLPDLILEIPEEEREGRIFDMDGMYFIDKEWLVGNGDILIDMENLTEPIFYWQVWVEISVKDFQNNLEKLKDGHKVELSGKLLSKIPFYSKSEGLNSKVSVRLSDELEIEVKIEEDSKLKDDQSKLITKERVIEIMQRINHFELYKEKKIFDKPFSKRLIAELIFAEREYIEKKKEFAINISSPNSILFQIVNSNMLESASDNKTGYGLHLSFDKSFEKSLEEINNFKDQEYAKYFEYHDLDKVPTYQMELDNDKERISKLVENLIVNVYEEQVDAIEIDNIEV